MRSSIDCTWLDWLASLRPSLSVVITQLAPELPPPTSVPVTLEAPEGALPRCPGEGWRLEPARPELCRPELRRLIGRFSALRLAERVILAGRSLKEAAAGRLQVRGLYRLGGFLQTSRLSRDLELGSISFHHR